MNEARMTVRLDPALRRKVERLAARKKISLNEALNRLLERAPDGRARDLATGMSDAEAERAMLCRSQENRW